VAKTDFWVLDIRVIQYHVILDGLLLVLKKNNISYCKNETRIMKFFVAGIDGYT